MASSVIQMPFITAANNKICIFFLSFSENKVNKLAQSVLGTYSLSVSLAAFLAHQFHQVIHVLLDLHFKLLNSFL